MAMLKSPKKSGVHNFSKYIMQLLSRIIRTAQFYLKLFSLLRPNSHIQNRNVEANIVVIASDFLPSIHGGVYRPLSWLKYASEHQIKAQLLTNQSRKINPVGLTLLSDAALAAQIQFCNEDEYELISKPTRIWLARPEFLLAALSKLELINKKQQISHLVATGPDFTSFAIAVIFAKKYPCKVHLDYRDEWTECPFEFAHATSLARMIEKFCIKHADSLTVTTKSQFEHFQATFGRSLNVYIKQNGCDDYLPPPHKDRQHSDRICLSHSGSIGGHNSVVGLINLLNSLVPFLQAQEKQFELNFCGVVDVYQTLLLHEEKNLTVSIKGQLTPAQAFEDSCNADINLLLIDNRFERYLPGKLFGYISSGNPILIIGTDHSEEIASLCKEYNVAHYFADVSNVDLMACANFIINAPRQKTAANDLAKFRQNYNRQKLAKEFLGMITDTAL